MCASVDALADDLRGDRVDQVGHVVGDQPDDRRGRRAARWTSTVAEPGGRTSASRQVAERQPRRARPARARAPRPRARSSSSAAAARAGRRARSRRAGGASPPSSERRRRGGAVQQSTLLVAGGLQGGQLGQRAVAGAAVRLRAPGSPGRHRWCWPCPSTLLRREVPVTATRRALPARAAGRAQSAVEQLVGHPADDGQDEARRRRAVPKPSTVSRSVSSGGQPQQRRVDDQQEQPQRQDDERQRQQPEDRARRSRSPRRRSAPIQR